MLERVVLLRENRSSERIIKFVAFLALLGSSFAINLNLSMVQVASPSLLQDFGVGYSELTWVFNSYQIAYAVLLPVCGAIGDKIGRKKTLLLGLIIFGIGSLLSGIAWNFWVLVTFRVVQAVGAAAIFPNGLVSGASFFAPDQRGRFMGIWSMSMSLGQVAGPSIGGLIIEFLGWRYIFFWNAIFIMVAFIVIGLLVKEDTGNDAIIETFDVRGTLMLGTIILSLVMSIVYGTDGSWTSPIVLVIALVGILTLPFFVRNESRHPNPIVDLRLFRSRIFLSASYCGGVHLIAIQASNMMLPLFLSGVQQLDGIRIGLIMLSLPLVRLVMSPLSGILADRLGSVLPVAIGLMVRTIALLGLSFITELTSGTSMVLLLLIDGVGASLIFAPAFKAVLDDTPPDKASSVTGTFNMLRLVMSVVGMVFIGILLDSYDPAVVVKPGLTPGYFQAYILLSSLTASGLLVVRNLGVGSRSSKSRKKGLPEAG